MQNDARNLVGKLLVIAGALGSLMVLAAWASDGFSSSRLLGRAIVFGFGVMSIATGVALLALRRRKSFAASLAAANAAVASSASVAPFPSGAAQLRQLLRYFVGLAIFLAPVVAPFFLLYANNAQAAFSAVWISFVALPLTAFIGYFMCKVFFVMTEPR